MQTLKILAYIIITIYIILIITLYFVQTRLVFHPTKLAKDYKFKLGNLGQEIFLTTWDQEHIHGLFFQGNGHEVIIYFHGNAGDLSGWKFVAEDFIPLGYNFLIIDYRGYGKSSGTISENGLYADAESAYAYAVKEKGFKPSQVIIYGRSIGTGVAIKLASKHQVKGLVLESPFSALPKLANEKLPLFFPSLFIKYKFNNLENIKMVKNPVIFLHGAKDELVPPSHTEALYKEFKGKKKKIIITQGSHNDLNSFNDYNAFLKELLPSFF